jgi:dynein heavy chain
VFVDDLNMPAREEYFAQPAIEILREWMDYSGWWHYQTIEFLTIEDTTFISAMGPPGGGRNPMTDRMTRHFNQIAHAEIEDSSLKKIFNTIMSLMMTRTGFPPELHELSDSIVAATISGYRSVIKRLRPTPSKFHYTFNLRDLSAVFQGVLSAAGKTITDTEALLRLWVHENQRTFKDRLVNDEDREWFDSMLGSLMERHMDKKWGDVIGACTMFGAWHDGPDGEHKEYRQIESFDEATTKMNEFLRSYNDEEQFGMRLVLFRDAVQHAARIARVLRQPGGNALLLGVGGSGRKSMTRLATFMCGPNFTFKMIELKKKYGPAEWREDLKVIVMEAALKDDEETVFCVADTDILHESFLEDLNGILNSGDVPNLYNKEEMDNIVMNCTGDCSRKGIQPTRLNAFAQYLLKVKSSLHIVLAMSPMDSAFIRRLRMFPALINCCVIDWFSAWPADALISVAKHQLDDEDGEDLKLDNIDTLTAMFQTIHHSVGEQSIRFKEEELRHNYVIPTSFLELLNTFTHLLNDKRKEVGDKKAQFIGGLEKLAAAEVTIGAMKAELAVKQPELKRTQISVGETKVKIEADKKVADAKVIIVTEKEAVATRKAAECSEMAEAAAAKLSVAEIDLADAVKCVKEIEISMLVTVRSYSIPPAGARNTATALCIMLKGFGAGFKLIRKMNPETNKKETLWWDTAKRYVFNEPRALLGVLQNDAKNGGFDRDAIPASVINELKEWCDPAGEKYQFFTFDYVRGHSVPCGALCKWVHAMYKYYFVALEAAPLREALSNAQAELSIVMAGLDDAKAELKQTQDAQAALAKKFTDLLDEEKKLNDDVENCSVRIARANKLVGGLGGEKVRWKQAVVDLDVSYGNIVGDVILCAGYIAYLGSFPGAYRTLLAQGWRDRLVELKIPHTPNCNLIDTLSGPLQIGFWQLASLPTDTVSTENAIIMSKAHRWSLLIDPQGQARKFVTKLGEQLSTHSNHLIVVKQSDKNFIRILEGAISGGKWVMIDKVLEELDSSLDPLLLTNLVQINGQDNIRLSDNPVIFDHRFQLYMVTSLSNPHYSPELQAKVTLLNFSITPDGLQDQMLGLVVGEERPDLEQERAKQVKTIAHLQSTMEKLQNSILANLSNAEGDILMNEELINQLDSSQVTAKQVAESMKESAIAQKEISEARSQYIPVAVRASLLYFACSSLVKIDPMYQYSLQWFTQLFLQGITDSKSSAETTIEQRLANINKNFTFLLYQNVCRSLFEVHKKLFALLLTVQIMIESGEVNAEEWRFLAAGAPPKRQLANPAPVWLTVDVWAGILALSDLASFSGLAESFTQHLNHFKTIYESVEPHRETLPDPWETKLDMFQKLLILKTLRPDKLAPALEEFVSTKSGPEFNDPIQLDLKLSLKASTPISPLVFILSTGADPAGKLYEFAKQLNFRDKLTSISLGQGQDVKAVQAIQNGKKAGNWVLLQNCHLYISWLPILEQIVSDIDPNDVHDDFRLWLTSCPTPHFPSSILQNGIKITDEPPAGLKANLLGSYRNFTDSFLSKSTKPVAFRKLLFSLCFFHACILDRRKFGSLGWNIRYEFTEPDLEVCKTQLHDYLDIYENIPYTVLHFMFYDINYGGRVTDSIDRRTIMTILDDFINPEVVETENYAFSPSGRYTSIEVQGVQDYLDYIDTFPSLPDPEIFGMHANADITSATAVQMSQFELIVRILPRVAAGGGGESQDEVVNKRAQDILERVPSTWEIEAVLKQYPTTYSESMNTVLTQETVRYNKLLTLVDSTLKDLQLALRGEIVMSQELEDMALSMFNNVIPAQWADQQVSYPSLMPLGAWVNDLIARCEFIDTWIKNDKPPVFWISGVFFPQAFLTGTLQNYARSHHKSVDSLAFSFHVLDMVVSELTTSPSDGVYIHGLFLEGCRWDASQHSLADSRPRKLFTSMPVMHLLPQEVTIAERKRVKPDVYVCPVYKTLTRAGTLSTTGLSTNFVMNVEIPSNVPQKKWIKAGVALFCALRYNA